MIIQLATVIAAATTRIPNAQPRVEGPGSSLYVDDDDTDDNKDDNTPPKMVQQWQILKHTVNINSSGNDSDTKDNDNDNDIYNKVEYKTDENYNKQVQVDI